MPWAAAPDKLPDTRAERPVLVHPNSLPIKRDRVFSAWRAERNHFPTMGDVRVSDALHACLAQPRTFFQVRYVAAKEVSAYPRQVREVDRAMGWKVPFRKLTSPPHFLLPVIPQPVDQNPYEEQQEFKRL